MARFVKAWPCLASALLVNLAFPPFNLGLLVLCALVPWLMSLQEVDGKAGFRSGWTFGFLMMLVQFFWIFSFVNRWVQNPVLATVPYLAASAAAGLYFGMIGWLVTLAWRLKTPWAIPLVWAGVEVFRSYIPVLAFPYGLLATPLWPYPWMIQTAYFGSIFLLSAWVVLVNLAILLALNKGSSWRLVRPYLAVSVLLVLGSWIMYNDPLPAARTPVSVGQPGVDLAFGSNDPQQLAQSVQKVIDQAQLHRSKLLVLPEGIARGEGTFPPQIDFELNPSLPTVFGGQRGQDPRYQTAFSFDGEWRYADKTRLVIFGEYVPFREQLPFLASSFNLPGGDLSPAESLTALKVGEFTVGPVLCFEGLFPDISYRQAQNGAQLIAIMSVDDWYMGTTAPDQLKAASVWRAVETRLPVVRSASTGYSLAIDPRGDVLAEAPIGKTTAFRVELPLSQPQLFQYFAAFPYISLAVLVVLPAAALIKSKKSPRP